MTSGTKFVTQAEMDAFVAAIAAAQAVADNQSATGEETAAAAAALTSATDTFKAAIKTGAYIPGGSGGSSSAGGSSAVNTPQTGDGTPLFLLGAAAVLCAGILALLIFLKRRLAAQES